MARTFLVVTIAVAVGGCTGGEPSAGTNGTPSPSTQGKTLPYGGAPKVEHPLPASVLSGDPCQEGLTTQQLTEALGTPSAGRKKEVPVLGSTCTWDNDASGAQVSVGYTTKVPDGLSAVYSNTKKQAKLWRELPPIQGFPAVAGSTFDATAKDGFCQVSVGITDQLTTDIGLTLGETKRGTSDPCDVAARIADMVVTNLRQKAGT
ncbi:DUF3558 domain-containing protein [Amycolatopsis sulphurea]|nr:DUF3558 domain-containing protein [Amycolatopsis sulphurea]